MLVAVAVAVALEHMQPPVARLVTGGEVQVALDVQPAIVADGYA